MSSKKTATKAPKEPKAPKAPKTPITDENIKDLVKTYITGNKTDLPEDLQDKLIEKWDVSKVENISGLFEGYEGFDEPLNGWKPSSVKNMESMFKGCKKFNKPLGKWSNFIDNVENMSSMFEGCSEFNNEFKVPLGNEVLTNTSRMFYGCSGFNHKSIGDFKLSNVTNMSSMFEGCSAFEQPINSWYLGDSVTNVASMFKGCKKFDNKLSFWFVKENNVTDMSSMFEGCEEFKQSLATWNVSNVTNMASMFKLCKFFNQPLNTNGDKWNVSNVINMESMFAGCLRFNQLLNNWNVSNVTNMNKMFYDCIIFDKPLNLWNVSNVTNMVSMFGRCQAFNQSLVSWNVNALAQRNSANMFAGCGISEENKPTFLTDQAPAVNPTGFVDQLQVHRAASKIKYAELNELLKNLLKNLEFPSDLNYPDFIQTSVTNLIENSDNTPETITQQKTDLATIMRIRLQGLDYAEKTIEVRQSIFYTLSYALTQPKPFKHMYVQTFLHDCVHAYDYQGDSAVTCSQGALERFIFSLGPACMVDEENEEYKKIVLILENPSVLIPMHIKEWYQLHKNVPGNANAFGQDVTVKDREANLKQYLLELFPNEEKLINELIPKWAEPLGFGDESFEFGGRRRKRKTKKMIRIKRKTRKIK
jgi:surface protein